MNSLRGKNFSRNKLLKKKGNSSDGKFKKKSLDFLRYYKKNSKSKRNLKNLQLSDLKFSRQREESLSMSPSPKEYSLKKKLRLDILKSSFKNSVPAENLGSNTSRNKKRKKLDLMRLKSRKSVHHVMKLDNYKSTIIELKQENNVLKSMQKMLMKRLDQQDNYFKECMFQKQKEVDDLIDKMANIKIEKSSLVEKIKRLNVKLDRYKNDMGTLTEFIQNTAMKNLNPSGGTTPRGSKSPRIRAKEYAEDLKNNFNAYVDVNLVVNNVNNSSPAKQRRPRKAKKIRRKKIKLRKKRQGMNFHNSFDHFVIKEEKSEEERGSIDDMFNTSEVFNKERFFCSKSDEEENPIRKIITAREDQKQEEKVIFGIDESVKSIFEKIGNSNLKSLNDLL